MSLNIDPNLNILYWEKFDQSKGPKTINLPASWNKSITIEAEVGPYTFTCGKVSGTCSSFSTLTPNPFGFILPTCNQLMSIAPVIIGGSSTFYTYSPVIKNGNPSGCFTKNVINHNCGAHMTKYFDNIVIEPNILDVSYVKAVIDLENVPNNYNLGNTPTDTSVNMSSFNIKQIYISKCISFSVSNYRSATDNNGQCNVLTKEIGATYNITKCFKSIKITNNKPYLTYASDPRVLFLSPIKPYENMGTLSQLINSDGSGG